MEVALRDVLGHLILGEETDWIPRMELILRHRESVGPWRAYLRVSRS